MKWWSIALLTSVLIACDSESTEITDLRTEEEKLLSEQEAISGPEPNDEPEIISQKNDPASPFSYRLIEGENGWGYQIFEDSAMRINQLHIPSLPGIRGFDTREQAEITAKYVLAETEKGNFPPTLTPDILRKIGAIK